MDKKYILSIIEDLELDVACMLDHFEDVNEADLHHVQSKLAWLFDEYRKEINEQKERCYGNFQSK